MFREPRRIQNQLYRWTPAVPLHWHCSSLQRNESPACPHAGLSQRNLRPPGDLSSRRRAHLLDDHFAHPGVAEILLVGASKMEDRPAALDSIDDDVVASAAGGPFHHVALADAVAVSFGEIGRAHV